MNEKYEVIASYKFDDRYFITALENWACEITSPSLMCRKPHNYLFPIYQNFSESNDSEIRVLQLLQWSQSFKKIFIQEFFSQYCQKQSTDCREEREQEKEREKIKTRDLLKIASFHGNMQGSICGLTKYLWRHCPSWRF